uniref:Uncharacterized protein n=1 Tax=Romanomermis culicivorax TaxID=13658 RepID=A0A915I728_ROMCU
MCLCYDVAIQTPEITTLINYNNVLDRDPPDDILALTETDFNGEFSLAGSDDEMGNIETKVEIHRSREILSISNDLLWIKHIAANYTNSRKIIDFGTINLDGC